jgi:hypothetical protein
MLPRGYGAVAGAITEDGGETTGLREESASIAGPVIELGLEPALEPGLKIVG